MTEHKSGKFPIRIHSSNFAPVVNIFGVAPTDGPEVRRNVRRMKSYYPDTTLPPVLIVDDCEDDVFLLRLRLREGGITNPILAFSSAAEALAHLKSDAAQRELPAMIFTDIRMPIDSGFALLGALRDNSAWDEVRVVVITSSNETTDLVRALELGASGYLIKFPPADILGDFVRNGPWFATPPRSAVLVSAAVPA
jgi:CheY-like chemotaxis protein